jgi:hypothetical protein
MKIGPRPKTIGRTAVTSKVGPKLKPVVEKSTLKQHTPSRPHNPRIRH